MMRESRRIRTLADIAEGLDALVEADPRLARVRRAAGEIPLRLGPPGFASLAAIVVGQMVSRASADAILARLAVAVDPLVPETVLAAGEPALRSAGLSRAKQATLIALAEAVVSGRLRLEALGDLDPAEAMAELVAIRGIGPWTAEVYLMFSAGHPDIFPAHDVALRNAVGHALEMDERPREKALRAIAESWSPWRSVAARLFWAYARTLRGADAAPPAPTLPGDDKKR